MYVYIVIKNYIDNKFTLEFECSCTNIQIRNIICGEMFIFHITHLSTDLINQSVFAVTNKSHIVII